MDYRLIESRKMKPLLTNVHLPVLIETASMQFSSQNFNLFHADMFWLKKKLIIVRRRQNVSHYYSCYTKGMYIMF